MADSSASAHNPRRVCRVCFRQFPSGYALGGHMRVHGALYAQALLEKEQRSINKKPSHTPAAACHGQGQTCHVTFRSKLGQDANDANHFQDSQWIGRRVNRGTSSFDGVGDEFKAAGVQFGAMAQRERELASVTIQNNRPVHSTISPSCRSTSDGDPDGTFVNRRKWLLYAPRHNSKLRHPLIDQEFAFKGKLITSDAASIQRACSKGDKVFWSERALFRHIKCRQGDKIDNRSYSVDDGTSDVVEYAENGEHNSSNNEENHDTEENLAAQVCGRGKRSRRMTGNATRVATASDQRLYEVNPNTASNEIEEDPDMAACLVLLSMGAARCTDQCQRDNIDLDQKVVQKRAGSNEHVDARFECRSCKRRFTSPQALGGHRASHKKTKGCFARCNDQEDDRADEQEQPNEWRSSTVCRWAQGRVQIQADQHSPHSDRDQKMVGMEKLMLMGANGHQCSSCHRVFATGQALGGHKRCHWVGEKPVEIAGSFALMSSVIMPTASVDGSTYVARKLDLNFPASSQDDEEEEVGMMTAAAAAPQPREQLPGLKKAMLAS